MRCIGLVSAVQPSHSFLSRRNPSRCTHTHSHVLIFSAAKWAACHRPPQGSLGNRQREASSRTSAWGIDHSQALVGLPCVHRAVEHSSKSSASRAAGSLRIYNKFPNTIAFCLGEMAMVDAQTRRKYTRRNFIGG